MYFSHKRSVVVVLAVLYLGVYAETLQGQVLPESSLANRIVSSVHREQPLGVVLDSLIREFQIPIGMEVSAVEKDNDEYEFDVAAQVGTYTVANNDQTLSVQRRPIYEAKDKLISINVENRELSHVMDVIVKQLDNYDWRTDDGGVVVIFPKSSRNEFIEGLLSTRLRVFTTGNNSMRAVGFGLTNAPETLAFIGGRGVRLHYVSLGSANRVLLKLPTRLDFKNASILEILNRITAAKKGGWLLRRCRHVAESDVRIIDVEF